MVRLHRITLTTNGEVEGLRANGSAVLLEHLPVDLDPQAGALRHGDNAAAVAYRVAREFGAQRVFAHVVLEQRWEGLVRTRRVGHVREKMERCGEPDGGAEHVRDHAHVVRRSEERRVGKECRSRWSPYQ